MVKTILKEVQEFKKASFATPVFMILEVIFETIIPIVMGKIIDISEGDNIDMSHILMYGGIMILLALGALFVGIMGGKYGAKASAGLAQFILGSGKEAVDRGVVISYDSRHFSPEFAQITATTLAAYGIKSFLSDELRPVPVISYSVRYFKAFAGVMITASHNPSKYNGYKVYGEDGGQVPPEAADIILNSIEAIKDIREVKSMDYDKAVAEGYIRLFGEEVDSAYTEMLSKLVIDEESIKRQADMSIVYTPLHGSGNKPVRRILDRIGFKNVHIVKEQELPDGSFPTVEVPNPESPAALSMAIELAKKTDASLVFGTDPDSDRIGVAARTTVNG
jgi:phosphoglucomutase